MPEPSSPSPADTPDSGPSLSRSDPADSGRFTRLLDSVSVALDRLMNHEGQLQRRLDQARMGAVADYLDRTARLIAWVGIGTFLGLLGGAAVLIVWGPVSVVGPAPLAVAAVVGGATATVAVLIALIVGVQYLRPVLRADRRRRRINRGLPQALVFMYALSGGDVRPADIFRQVGEAADIYGPVGTEFQTIATEVSRLNVDLVTAVQDAKRRTPSDLLASFFEEFLTTIEVGGSVETFFEQTSREHLRRARHRQEAFIDRVATWVEIYFTVVFAGAVFLLVSLTILSFAGAGVLSVIVGVVYGVLPVTILGAYFIVVRAGDPFETGPGLNLPVVPEWLDVPDEAGLYGRYRRYKRRKSLRRELSRLPLYLQRQPATTLLFTVPVALLFAVVIWRIDIGLLATATATPLRTTLLLGVVPALVPSTGLMLAYEFDRRRYDALHRRFPGALRVIAAASKNGIRFVNALELVTRRQSGRLAEHFHHLETDIRLTGDVEGALYRFADDMLISQVDRIVHTTVEALKATPEYGSVLAVMATDSEERLQQYLNRQRALRPYAFLLVIGVLSYLLVVVIFEQVFFPSVADLPSDLPLELSGISPAAIEQLELALFHSVVILAVGNSLLVGRLIEGNVLAGLKYANALLVIIVLTAVLV